MATQPFKQADHKLLVIPGPIEFTDDVLLANATPSVSHVSVPFANIFGDCIRLVRKVVYTETGQPFLVAGSGTLGWDMTAANLLEPGDEVLMLINGFFGERFQASMATYGAKITTLVSNVGEIVSEEELAKALRAKKYKMITITHVDTSTATLSPIAAYSKIIREHNPEAFIVVDAICAVASEEIQFDKWDLDVVITATQKGLGAPPGLAVLVVSQRAMKAVEDRKSVIPNYYGSFKNWLPVHKAYEAGTPAYFATPPVQLVNAFRTALRNIVEGPVSLEQRFELHKQAGKYIKDSVEGMGLKLITTSRGHASNSLTTIYYPEGVQASDVLPKLAERGIVAAGGIHSQIGTKYFRIGHMGVTAVDRSRGDLEHVIKNVREVLAEAGYQGAKSNL